MDDGRPVFSRYGSGLWQVAASGGEPTPLTTADATTGEFAHVWPQALPDGRVLYGVLFLASSRAQIRVLVDGVSQSVLEGSGQARYVDGRLLYVVGTSLFSAAFDPLAPATVGESVEIVAGLLLTGEEADRAVFGVGGDGTLAYVPVSSTAYGRSLVRVSRDGRARVVPPTSERVLTLPRVSPVDSTRMLFVDRGDLYSLDVASCRSTGVSLRRACAKTPQRPGPAGCHRTDAGSCTCPIKPVRSRCT